MIDKKIRLALHILLYLMLFVGILFVMGYILEFLQGSLTEGFQLTQLTDQAGKSVKNCTKATVFGKDIVLCASSNDAQNYLMINTTKNYFIPLTTQICYTDSNDSGLANGSNVNYVCFQRPAPMIFDTNTNVERRQDPIMDGDEVPESNRASIEGVCDGYQSLLANADIRYQNTTNTFSTVTYVQSTIQYIASGLATVSTTNCRSGTVLSQIKANACGTVSTSIKNFANLQSNGQIGTVSTTLNQSRINISTMMKDLVTTFTNTGCRL